MRGAKATTQCLSAPLLAFCVFLMSAYLAFTQTGTYWRGCGSLKNFFVLYVSSLMVRLSTAGHVDPVPRSGDSYSSRLSGALEVDEGDTCDLNDEDATWVGMGRHDAGCHIAEVFVLLGGFLSFLGHLTLRAHCCHSQQFRFPWGNCGI